MKRVGYYGNPTPQLIEVAESAQIDSDLRVLLMSSINNDLYLVNGGNPALGRRMTPATLVVTATTPAELGRSDVPSAQIGADGQLYAIGSGIDVDRAPADLSSVTDVIGSSNQGYGGGLALLDLGKLVGFNNAFGQTSAVARWNADASATDGVAGMGETAALGTFGNFIYTLATSAGGWAIHRLDGTTLGSLTVLYTHVGTTVLPSHGNLELARQMAASPAGVLFFRTTTNTLGKIFWYDLGSGVGGELALGAARISHLFYHTKTACIYAGSGNTIWAINPATREIVLTRTIVNGVRGVAATVWSITGDADYLYFIDQNGYTIRKYLP